MGYSLGIDLGTTFVAAAVAYPSRVETFTLGDRTVVTPSVVYLRDDGVIVTSEAASRRSVSNPERVGREFKRRIGDPTPVMLGGTPHAVTDLLAAVLRDVLTRVVQTEGRQPERVVLTHPANWGPFRRGLFEQVPSSVGLDDALMTTEPEAAAAHYAATRDLDEGAIVAVYDLGGGTFDATVLRKREDGVEILGTPEGIERLGGVDFDEAILNFVNYSSGGALSDLDMRDPQTITALARLRQDCVLAKEALSIDDETILPLFLPERHLNVTITRADFEGMIRAPIESTIQALVRTLRSAGVTPEELSAVLLVGGSSRIPLVARMVSEELGRPIVVDTHPKYAVALGAATLARVAATGRPVETVPGLGEMSGRGANGHPANGHPANGHPADDHRTDDHADGGPAANGHTPDGHAPEGSATAVKDEGPAVAGPAVAGSAVAGSAVAGPPPVPTSATEADAAPSADPVAVPADGPAEESEAATAGPDAPRSPAPSSDSSAVAPIAGGSPTVGPVPPDAQAGPPNRPARQPARPYRPEPARATAPVPHPGSAPPPADPRVRYGPPPPGPPPPGPQPQVGPPRGDQQPAGPPTMTRLSPKSVAVVSAVFLVLSVGLVGLALGWFDRSSATPPPPPVASAPVEPVTLKPSVPVPSLGAAIPVGATPGFGAMSPNGRQLYIANRGAKVITVLDTSVNQVVATIPVEAGPPQFLTFAPDGKRVYVSIFNTERTIAAVAILDTTTNAIVSTIPVRTRPFAADVSKDGRYLWVPNHDSGSISVIDTVSMTVVRELNVAPNPHWVSFSKDGSRAYTANHESNLISVLDTVAESVVAQVPVGVSPHSLAVNPDRPLVANVNYDGGSVSCIDTNTNSVIATIPVGKNPQEITWAPDGRHAYVANVGDGTVSVISRDEARVTATIPTGRSPTSVTVTPDGSFAYVTNLDSGTLTVLNIGG